MTNFIYLTPINSKGKHQGIFPGASCRDPDIATFFIMAISLPAKRVIYCFMLLQLLHSLLRCLLLLLPHLRMLLPLLLQRAPR